MHPVTQNTDGKINTLNGRVIDLLAPTPDMIHIDDIAAALSKICRFNGQTHWFYSVAQHSVLVSHMVPKEHAAYGLMHDAAEAYIGDITTPVKHLMGEKIREVEAGLMAAICFKFGLFDKAIFGQIKRFDVEALLLEHEALQKNNTALLTSTMYNYRMCKNFNSRWWSPEFAEEFFITRFYRLFQ